MDFYQKYNLIEPLAGEGTRSFRAKQASTGRDVTVHLLVGGRSPENDVLLARLRALPPQAMGKLIEVGDNEGTTYVATAAPPFQHLSEWLNEQEAGPGLARAGMWKAPETPAPPVAPPAPAPPPPPPVSAPGEFTRLFQASQSPSPQPLSLIHISSTTL